MVYEEEKRFDLVVKLDKNKRENLEDVKNLLIPNSNGTQIPLSLLANVSIKDGPNQIQREDAKRRIVVGFNVKNRDVQSIVQELKQKVETQMDFSPGYFVTYGGAFENLNKAKKRLMIAVPIALVLIFILLFFAFKSVKQGLLIYTAIPLSAIGGILFLAMRGMPFSISAGIGFIALFGVAVLNGIVLVAEFNSLKERKVKNLNLIVLRAGKNRFRPVLMTAFAASLGFLPMALSNGAGAEVQRPLATVVIGGLVIATFLTLFLLPILYFLFERNNKPKVNLLSILFIAGATLTMNKVGAQTPIPLQSAIDSALQNNLEVKNQKLLTEYQSKLLNSYDIPQTVISGEYGQINSYYKDSKFGISQTISFPQVYSKQNALSDAKYQGSIINTHLKEAELIKQVSEVFFDIVYMREKRQILIQYDSLFGEFINKTKLKFNSGDANILEVYTAETQKNEISIQLKQLKYDMEVKELEFELLLNTRNPYIPQQEKPLLGISIGLDFMSFENHPLLKYLNLEKSISQLKTQVEKSKLLPSIFLGYNSTSMVGTGADNILYSSSKRFNSIQFGLGLPLFYGHQQAIIRSSTIQEKVSENNYQMELRNKTFEYQQELKKYIMLNDMVRYFEDTALLQAKTINETADKKFFTGDINYLEWLLLSNNATMIKTNYINAKRELNFTTIKINYLINFN